MVEMEKEEDLIEAYFSLGFHQSEILNCLKQNHNIQISRRTLQRIFKYKKLFRRKNYSEVEAVVNFIKENVKTHGQLLGYRWMHLRCLQHGLTVTQEVVRLLLKELDPVGVDYRSRQRLRRREYKNNGPNFLWHMDCYDKLKPFGICISGCIDGFSRKLMWLKAGPNSNNPRIIAGYYLEAIREVGGCPQSIRADMGTENGTVENIQTYLSEYFGNRNDLLPPFLIGTSQHNQRIEAWWSILRKHQSQYWLNIFHSFKENGIFNGTLLDKALIQFCFLPIIQDELHLVVKEWDSHQIRSSRNSISPPGRPFIMYYMPQILGSQNYLCPIPEVDFLSFNDICLFTRLPCDKEIYDLSVIVMAENNLTMPTEVGKALSLYEFLRTELMEFIRD